MGLTTMGVGQCGQDVYTLNEMARPMIQQVIASFSLVPPEQVTVDWNNLSEFRKSMEEQGIGANVAPYVGFMNLRAIAMGLEGSGGERFDPTEAEMEEMKTLLAQQMQQGAFGFSTGLKLQISYP